MSVYALTPLVKSDIFLSYIAEDNVDVADRVEQAIFDACEFLAESPLSGHFRRDITPTPFLDADPLSQLHSRLPARDNSSTGRGRSAWKEKYATPSDP